MKTCPFCGEKIRDEAIKCRYCGEFLGSSRHPVRPVAAGPSAVYGGFEYRSELEILGWPLIHVARGVNPSTGLPRVARGVIALGDIAIGLVAVGGVAAGGFALGGLSLGVFALGGASIGAVAFGGLALGLYLAVGGAAISTMYAIGGAAVAPHAIGGTGADPEFLRQLERWLPGIRSTFPNTGQ